MIDEAVLEHALSEAADSYEPSAGAVDAVLRAYESEVRAHPPRVRRHKQLRWLAVAAGLAVLVLGISHLPGPSHKNSAAGAVGQRTNGSGVPDGPEVLGQKTNGGTQVVTPVSGGVGGSGSGSIAGPVATAQPSTDAKFVPGSPGGTTAGGSTGGTVTTTGGGTPVESTSKVIEKGQLQVEVKKGELRQRLATLTGLADKDDGLVANSKVTTSGEAPSAVVTLRVPNAKFATLLQQVRALGTVKLESTSSSEVTSQYVDLQARIQSLTAARDRFLTLLSRANSIGEVLSVQQRVDNVQAQLDQAQGQLKVLADQTTYATLTVTIAEPGAAEILPEPVKPPKVRTGFAKAWHDAVHRFTGGLQGLVAASGPIALVLLLLAVCWLGYRGVRRRLV